MGRKAANQTATFVPMQLSFMFFTCTPKPKMQFKKSLYYKDTCSRMFTAALLTIAKTWSQSKCPSMIDWTGNMWHIYTMEYYAATKNDEFVSFVGTWINLETIILSKLTQEHKSNTACSHS